MPKKKPKYFIRTRKHTGEKLLDIWFMGIDGAAEYYIMHGKMNLDTITDFTEEMEKLGIKIEQEIRDLSPPETKKEVKPK